MEFQIELLKIPFIEEWKPLPVENYCENYFISNHGRVANKKKILSPSSFPGKKPKINVYYKGFKKSVQIHNMVAKAFLPNPNNIKIATHIDRDVTNNLITNLQWLDSEKAQEYREKAKGKIREKDEEVILGKPILYRIHKNFPNYLITPDAKIYSLKSGRYLSPRKNGGYIRIDLSNDGFRKGFGLHVLMALLYVENPNSTLYDIVNHDDEDKLNNNYNNLEWTDSSGNSRHTSRMKEIRGIPISKFDLTGKLITKYKDIIEASKINNVKCSKILQFYKNEIMDVDGYRYYFTK